MNSFLHSAAWQRFQERVGNQSGKDTGNLYLRKSVSSFTYWLSSRCEISAHYKVPEFAKTTPFIRLEPNTDESYQHLQEFAKKNHFSLASTFAVQPRQTSIIDLDKSYEEIIQEMKPKHRYNIRVAEKHGVQIEIISQNCSESFERFWHLLEQTANRHDFRTHSKEYYRLMTDELQKDDMIHFAFASKDGIDCASLILITYEKTATYLHGGSTTEFKELMAPYLLHAEVIKFAQSKKLTHYDLWGTDLVWNPEKKAWQLKPDSSSSGTSRFKLGFNGEIVTYPGTFDLILKPFWYTLYKTIRKIRSGKRSFA